MAKCANCGAIIIAGGVRHQDRRYCSHECREAGHLAMLVSHLPSEEIDQRTQEVYEGVCPRCGGAGPVDVHSAHYIWSAAVIYQISGNYWVCCRSCGRKRQLGAILFCAGLGWWS